jgi:hypothetical protein
MLAAPTLQLTLSSRVNFPCGRLVLVEAPLPAEREIAALRGHVDRVGVNARKVEVDEVVVTPAVGGHLASSSVEGVWPSSYPSRGN